MLKAGFARIDITPPFGTILSGYFYPRYTDGVLDPLQLNALAVSNGNDTALIIVADIIGIRRKVTEAIRTRIEKKHGVKADHIMVSALHQHTSFRWADTPERQSTEDPAFIDVLYRKFEDVAKMALDDMQEATLETAVRETAVQISFTRRYIMKDGPVATNPGRCNPNIVRPASDPDNNVRLLRFRRPGAKDIAFVNFSTHPDVIGGTKASADWPGFVRRYVEKDNENACCILLNGAQGDVNHLDFSKAKQFDNRYEYSAFMGRTIADTVKEIWDTTVPHERDDIFGEITTIYTRTNDEGAEKYDECKKFCDAADANTLGYKPHITELAYNYRIVRLRNEPIFRPVPVSVIGIGDVAIVGFGGEPFTVYATNARNAAPDKFVIAACCTNGYEGYLPSAVAFTEGGYESSGSFFTSEIEEKCCNAAKEMLAKF